MALTDGLLIVIQIATDEFVELSC